MKKLLIFILCMLSLISQPSMSTLAADGTEASALPCSLDSILTIIPGRYGASASPDSQTVIAIKTFSCLDADQNILWTLSMTASFTYDGTCAWCTGCSHEAVSASGVWRIADSSHNRSGNLATAEAAAEWMDFLGISREYIESLTISCSPNGEIS